MRTDLVKRPLRDRGEGRERQAGGERQGGGERDY